ncbi:NB-ARC domain-containing protein [Actinoplanes auranticolor]|uniref:NB-ARC domain-containing protein n=1 Tax=Actinoplanes auranticolor TaxID=47988 RepID=UPI001BB3C54D|nr:NB-ARC domain-containing protein [Actinoplanes auranticolor]
MGGLVNVFTSGSRHSWWLIVTLVVAVVAWAAIEAARAGRGGRAKAAFRAVAAFPESSGPMVARPEPLGEIVRALTGGSRRSGPLVAITGGGGFGKTTLAWMAAQHPDVRRRYPETLTVVLGQDLAGAALAAKLNDISERVTGLRPGYASSEQAAQHLGDALDKHEPMLLVIDDVWTAEQYRHFRYGGRRCARLVTTRMPDLILGDAIRVDVGAMQDGESYDLLTAGVAGLPADVTDQLRERTGRWPLLLAICNGLLRQAVARGDDPTVVGRRTVDLLDRDGPTALDGASSDRRTAGRTIEASLEALPPHDSERFAELGLFAEDTEIPEQLVAWLWRRTGGLTGDDTVRLCRTLAGLSLVESYREGDRSLRLHDVVRGFLRLRCGKVGLQVANEELLDAVAASLVAAEGSPPPWWLVPAELTYIWQHLRYHMTAAGRAEEFDLIVTDPRWALRKLQMFGAAALSDDLTGNPLPAGRRLADQLDRHGHLLAPTDPQEAVVDIFLGREPWGTQHASADVRIDPDRLPEARWLVPLWPLPDLPDPALRRVMRASTWSYNNSPPWSPDGRSLLAERAESRDVVLRHIDTGEPTVTLAESDDAIWPVVFAPDGSWVATESSNRNMQAWDTGTGRQTTLFTSHRRQAHLAVAAPNGEWLATAMNDDTIRAWNTGDPARSRLVRGHRSGINALVAGPDGSWLGSVSDDRTARIWYHDNRPARILTGHTDRVTLAVAAGPNRLVTAGPDCTVWVWDVRTGKPVHVFRRLTPAVAVMTAPDGSWLAIVERHVITRWTTDSWALRSAWQSASEELTCSAIHPNGSQLAAGTRSGEVQIWDVSTGRMVRRLLRHSEAVLDCAIRADGTLLSRDSEDVRVWDLDAPAAVSGTEPGRPAETLVVATDSSWFAVGSSEGLTIWDVAGQSPRVLTHGSDDDAIGALLAGRDAGQLVVARTNRLEMWDVGLSALHSTVTIPFFGATSVAWSSDDRVLSAGMDQLVRMHDAGMLEQFGALDTVTGRLIPAQHGRAWDDATSLHPVRDLLRRAANGFFGSRRLRVPFDRLWALRPMQVLIRRFNIGGTFNAVVRWGNDQLVRLLGPKSWRTRVIASPDGRYAATLHTDGSVRIWKTEMWRSIGRFVEPEMRFYYYQPTAWAVAVMHGTTVTYRSDLSIRIWSAEDNTQVTVADLRPDEGYPTALAYSADAEHLCAVTGSGALIVWATQTWRRVAMQRVEGALQACAWIEHSSGPAIVAVGGRGVYLFGLCREALADAADLRPVSTRLEGSRIGPAPE